jgi:hypothetical protein
MALFALVLGWCGTVAAALSLTLGRMFACGYLLWQAKRAGIPTPVTPWNRRLGGLLPEAWPFALAALRNLDLVLPLMKEFKAHALQLAAAINADGGACTVPEIPQTTMFHIHVPIPRAQLERGGLAIQQKHGIQLFSRTLSQPNPRWSAFEVSVGENAMAFSPDELVQLVHELLAQR